jgi:predicted phosphodiesterase
MKTVYIGDIHGRDTWKQIVDQEQDADCFVFVGDYFDSFDLPGVVQLQNFLDIIEYKTTVTDKEVVLLFGNHDYHYMPGFTGIGYSGYQAAMAYQFRDAISQNLDHLQMCHFSDGVLSSHAGVGYNWLVKTFGTENDESQHYWSTDTEEGILFLVEMINEYFIYKPQVFDFNGINPYGDDVWQTPIWIRPKSLMRVNKDKLNKKLIQVVGHTHQTIIDIKGKSTGGRYYFIDTLDNKQPEYLIYENQKFTKGVLAL